jgi:hypothetical protein
MSASIKILSDAGNRDGYEPTYGVTFPEPFFKCSAAHRQSPSDHWFFIETENINCMVDMRDFPHFKFDEPPSSLGKDMNIWWSEWCEWHERKILAVAEFLHLKQCKICLYNMIRDRYFPTYPKQEHQH